MSQPEKPKPVIRREEECRRLVTEYEASGMTMTEFSAERGLARGSLSGWRKRFLDEVPTVADGRSGSRQRSGPLIELSGLFDHPGIWNSDINNSIRSVEP